MKNVIQILLVVSLFAISCQENESASPVNESLNAEIIDDFSGKVAQASYDDLYAKTTLLYSSLESLNTHRTPENLTACRNSWKAARQAWEQTESFLFGPVSTDNIDPRIDTWPVNFQDLQGQLDSGNPFTEDYVNDLEDALKGFHPIEYLLFGQEGLKAAGDLTDRDLEYLLALGSNLKQLTSHVDKQWDESISGNYFHSFTTAGKGSANYPTQRAALEELVNAMAAICEEVANGKIEEVYLAQDPSLEESPFAGNSITDFTNNIQGVENVYLAKYGADGKGMEDLVKTYKLTLDGQIKADLNAAKAALGNITLPFGQAIIDQPVQVQNAVTAINKLKATLTTQLLPFVQQHSK